MTDARTETQDQRILAILRALRGRYSPKPTAWSGLDEESARRLTAQWITTLRPHGIDHVADACNEWLTGERADYFPSLQDIDALARAGSLAEQQDLTQRALAETASSCDGSGWTQVPGGKANTAVPCGRCNPYLHLAFSDRRKWARYMRGESLGKLDVGVKLVHGELVTDSPMPGACLQSDREEPTSARPAGDRPMPAWMRDRNERPL